MKMRKGNNLPKQTKSHHGFSLIELLVSSTIILLLILGTAQALLYAMHIKSRVQNHTKATEIAKIKLEYLKSLSFEAPQLKPDTWTETISQPNSQNSYHLNGRIIDLSMSLKRVEIECYSDLHPQKSTRIALLISKQLGF